MFPRNTLKEGFDFSKLECWKEEHYPIPTPENSWIFSEQTYRTTLGD